MRRIIVIICAMMVSVAAVNAQNKGEFAAGVSTTFKASNYSALGIGLIGQYSFTEQWRVTANLDYYAKGAGRTDLTAACNYIVPISSKFAAYGILGLGLGFDSNVVGGSTTMLISTLGAGCQYTLNSNFRVNLDLDFRFDDFGWSNFFIGPSIVYMF